MPVRPHAVAFDVVQTLMSLEPQRNRLTEAGFASDDLERWFDRIIRDGMALTLAGDYLPFPKVAAGALRAIARADIDNGTVEHVLAGFAELPAHPDAAPAMDLLASNGVRIVCLSNGPAASTADFLHRSALEQYVEQVLSVEDVQQWKPAPEVYQYATRSLGLPPGQVALVAVHAWDCHGAHRARLTTGWASRLEGRLPDHYARPDVIGTTLVDVARGLLDLPPA